MALAELLGDDWTDLSICTEQVPMGFGFVYILNSSFIALLASVDNADVPAVTGALWLFRTAGQVVGVASTSAIMQ